MEKVLMLASVASMIDQFNMPLIKMLQVMGYSVDVACNFKQGNTCSDERVQQLIETLTSLSVDYFQIDFARNITNIIHNIKAYKQVKKLLKEKKYTYVHCHSPIGGVIGRLTGHKTKAKVIYTAHGFHFYKGAPLKNWILYYPIEKLCSHWTDVLITINKEDYALACKKMKARRVEYVPGVGIDVAKFKNTVVNKQEKRREIGVPDDAFVLLSVGELNANKNHEVVVKAIAQIKNPNIHYTIAGGGDKRDYLINLSNDLGISDQLHLLGYRKDVAELYKVADVYVHPSFREGLPVSVMEAMASGLPIICSKIRGNMDLIDENGGYLFEPQRENECKDSIQNLLNHDHDVADFGLYNQRKIERFSIDDIIEEMRNIYNNKTATVKIHI